MRDGQIITEFKRLENKIDNGLIVIDKLVQRQNDMRLSIAVAYRFLKKNLKLTDEMINDFAKELIAERKVEERAKMIQHISSQFLGTNWNEGKDLDTLQARFDKWFIDEKMAERTATPKEQGEGTDPDVKIKEDLWIQVQKHVEVLKEESKKKEEGKK